MPLAWTYRLRFQAPLHLDSWGSSSYAASDAFIHSDTLSAALLSAWALLEPEGAAERAANPPFLVSSAFPWFREHHFLPRPVASRAVLSKSYPDHAALKALRWLSVELWRQVAGERRALDDLQEIEVKQGGIALPRKGSASGWPEWLWREEINTRLTLDRGDNQGVEGLLFDFARIHFHPDGGLYFLARLEEAQLPGFHAALTLLGDQGIGADRNVGNGWFRWEEGPELPLPEPRPDTPMITLSLLNPRPEEQQAGWLDNAAWDLIERGGWIGQSPHRRHPLRMFVEGSRFSRPLQGRTVNLLPGALLDRHHPAFRDGRVFCVAKE